MIVYSGTKSQFHSDVLSNDIGNIIYNAFQGATGRRTNRAEINSWTNSLMYMHNVLEDPAIPADAGVAIEYHINPNHAGHGRVPRSSGPRAKRYARQARGGVCRPEGAPAMRGVSSSRNLPAPRSSKRIDFILTGTDAANADTASAPFSRIDHGKIKPSKSLADSLAGMLKGNQKFVMVTTRR